MKMSEPEGDIIKSVPDDVKQVGEGEIRVITQKISENGWYELETEGKTLLFNIRDKMVDVYEKLDMKRDTPLIPVMKMCSFERALDFSIFSQRWSETGTRQKTDEERFIREIGYCEGVIDMLRRVERTIKSRQMAVEEEIEYYKDKKDEFERSVQDVREVDKDGG